MCGIVGIVLKTETGFSKTVEDTFNQLLYANTLRGDDSTGVIAVEKDTTFHIAKDASPGFWFIDQFAKTNASRAMWSRGKAMIGHNRKKTIGAVSDETAHPFVINDDFALVHNGTLYGHKKLADTDVDSHALAHVLSDAFHKEDYKEALEETLGKVDGAYAVAMYDQRHNKVRLLRNKDRPLCIVETAGAFYFASEGPMLFWVLLRNNVDMKNVKIETVPEHTVLDICLDNNTIERTVITPKKPLPQSTTPTKTGGRASTGNLTFRKKVYHSQDDVLSKNRFKKFRRKYLNKSMEWWAEDFIETNFPKTELEDGETEFTITGVSDSLAEEHLITAKVDLKDVKIKSGDGLTDRLWHGIVADMSFEKRSGRIMIHMGPVVPVPESKPKLNIPQKGEYDRVESTMIGGEAIKIFYNKGVEVSRLTFAELMTHAEKEALSTVH